ncbi:hypothetical protein [Taibaiella soli]|uniref:Uncharacterized protein n=1 Tax=Taibaiella soli TaxID=1649169 RepID=A0A2W2ALY5_9BACT|nr:hypothetical protein [Taibaiella soli]PZF73310.1 hypothetical protein DN068_09075 [Taibaiella soli]
MTPRSLFIIILRIIGLFLLKDIFLAIVQALQVFSMRFGPDDSPLIAVFIAMISVVISCACFWFTVAKPEIIIDKFKLDQGFKEEKFTVLIDQKSIVDVVVMTAGIFLLVDTLPLFGRTLYQAYQRTKMGIGGNDSFTVPYQVIKIIIAGILVFYHKEIAALLDRKKIPENARVEDFDKEFKKTSDV